MRHRSWHRSSRPLRCSPAPGPPPRRRIPCRSRAVSSSRVSYDWLYTQPLHFAEHPVEDLVGQRGGGGAVRGLRLPDPRRHDPHRRARVQAARPRGRRHGVSVRPERRRDAGAPRQRRGSAGHPHRLRRRRRAADVRADRRAGVRRVGARSSWPIDRPAGASEAMPSSAGASAGSRATRTDGDRIFAEGGGGLNSGPIGVELSIKFAWNHLDRAGRSPLHHRADHPARHGILLDHGNRGVAESRV